MFLFLEQIRRLTWFTRFDPAEPKEQVFNVESFKTAEVVTSQTDEREDVGTERQSSNGTLNSADSTTSESSVQSRSRLISALLWLCGMERPKKGESKPVPPPAPVCSLEEKPRLRLIVNINLIVCLSVTVFIYGYWA